MVPLSAASSENGAAEPRLNEGGSTRLLPKGPPVRRRERMPMRLDPGAPRVGERPAGAESGVVVVDLAAREVLILVEAGDLKKVVRGRWDGLTGLRISRGECKAVEGNDGVEATALVKAKGDDGLAKSLTGKKAVLSTPPFDRLEKRVGSTFSKSSLSTASDALRLPDGLAGRAVRLLVESPDAVNRMLEGWAGTNC